MSGFWECGWLDKNEESKKSSFVSDPLKYFNQKLVKNLMCKSSKKHYYSLKYSFLEIQSKKMNNEDFLPDFYNV
jgi:hypothetical protein